MARASGRQPLQDALVRLVEALLLAGSDAQKQKWLPKIASGDAIGTLALQLLVGIFMVLEAFPLALATGHNGGAALLLLAMLMLNRRLREA